MLLRYGWGLSPKEVCALVAGLSPRAYRKEVTRGVEQLIERLRQVESGEWCASREPLLRDYVAGVSSDEERLQVERHLSHCRACSGLAAKLSGHLQDASTGFALAGIAGLLGSGGFALGAKVAAALAGLRDLAGSAIERIEGAASSVASTTGGHASGAVGAGAAAKVVAGGGGKALLACLGTGAAATACVAAGVVPVVDLNGDGEVRRPAKPEAASIEHRVERLPDLTVAPGARSVAVATESAAATPAPQSRHSVEKAEGKDVSEAAPTEVSSADLAEREFDPVAQAAPPAEPVEPAPAPDPIGPKPPDASAGTDAESIAGDEFGP
jgi:hypothetical protein